LRLSKRPDIIINKTNGTNSSSTEYGMQIFSSNIFLQGCHIKRLLPGVLYYREDR